ncbi:hypothetical protein AB0O91_39730 [Kitasatospora sp. NPDC089797]|uniref:hypothetical protein n=1 Tax=Kitasatospora sp. NPDC089797 TaxID=3155298 RepID=UPI0034481E7C
MATIPRSHVQFEEKDLLTWTSVYWFTNTIGTSFAPHTKVAPPVPYVAAPTVQCAFAHATAPRHWRHGGLTPTGAALSRPPHHRITQAPGQAAAL